MIQANELRIGNKMAFVVERRRNPINRVVEVCNIGRGQVVVKDVGLDMCFTDDESLRPLPITPEILEAAGFKYGVVEGIARFSDSIDDKEEGDTYYWDFSIQRTELVDSHNFSLVKWGEQDHFTFQLERGLYRQKIKYVHTLQNLMFALTGNELTINL